MKNYLYILSFLVICQGVRATWPLDWGLGGWGFGAWTSHLSPIKEKQDEANDAAILKAVVTSMQDWERNRRDLTRAKRADSAVCYTGVGCFMGSAPFNYLGVLPAPPAEVGTSFHFFSPKEPNRARSLAFEEIIVPAMAVSPTVPSILAEGQFRGRRDNTGDSIPAVPVAAALTSSETNNSTPSVNTSTTPSPVPASADSVTGTDGVLEVALNLGFNSSLPTKMIVHGFGSSCSHVWVHEMRSALMAVEDCNVICVDWEPGASIPNYVRAAANARLVGKQVALLLRRLRAQLGLDARRVHLIGFSLGAHVAGFAGAETPGLSRITGLDPAGPLFESQEVEARLDASDAQFVDVIHSNGENLILGGLGSWQPMGHVDFYPNGGREQKGCSNILLGAVSDISLLWSSSEGDSRSLCNHRRAYKFFTDSVSPRCPFPAFPCESYEDFLEGSCFQCNSQRQCGNMGYYADRSAARGPLFLITRDNEPFCAHQFYVRVDNTQSPEPVVTNGRLQVVLSSAELNETFTLTQKDDELLETGESLERLVVAHPVMSHPTSAQLIYTSYSGWLSSGTSTWTVDKILVTDAFGKSMSFCKRGMILSSGVPLLVPLFPGDCNPPRGTGLEYPVVSVTPSWGVRVRFRTFVEHERELKQFVCMFDGYFPGVHVRVRRTVNNEIPVESSSTIKTTELNYNNNETSILVDGTERKNRTGIDINITLNKSENKNAEVASQNDQVTTNQSTVTTSTTTDYPLYHRPWLNEQNNSLTDTRYENSRSFPLSETTKRHITNLSSESSSIINNAGTTGSWPFWWRSINEENNNNNNNETPITTSNSSLITVQMLPQRLASILQQAEQYARATITSVATTIIGSNNKDENLEPQKRRPKYFPPFSSLFGYDTKINENKKNDRDSSLRSNLPLIRQENVGFSPMQIIKSQEWRISKYIPLRRYSTVTRKIDLNIDDNNNNNNFDNSNNNNKKNITDNIDRNNNKNNSDINFKSIKPSVIGPR